jgi:pimeloyl-ACP methyl ester carboxylesterase
MPATGQEKNPAASSVRLPGFEYQRIDVEGLTINCAVKGAGPPVLLLHGYPENHLMWRHVAPALAEDHTVVLADLRGYGDSGKPAPDAVGLVYSKRLMARDQVGLMRQLGTIGRAARRGRPQRPRARTGHTSRSSPLPVSS